MGQHSASLHLPAPQVRPPRKGGERAGTRVDGTPYLIKLPGSHLSVSGAETLPFSPELG